MEQPRKSRLSPVTLVVAGVIASLLLAVNIWAPYPDSTPGHVEFGWPLPTHSGQTAATGPQTMSWHYPHLIANLIITVILTCAIASIVEWVMRGGKLPRFSLLSMVFTILIAGTMMHVNFIGSENASSRGWPFTCAGVDRSDLYGMAMLGNIIVGIVFSLFGGLLCEFILGAIEDMRDYHRVHSGEVSWTNFAQDLHEKRKQEREGKSQGHEPDPPPLETKPGDQKTES